MLRRAETKNLRNLSGSSRPSCVAAMALLGIVFGVALRAEAGERRPSPPSVGASSVARPFSGVAGRWIRLASLGRVYRPEVPSDWSPFSRGRWEADPASRSLRWIPDFDWEREAAERGRWTRVATWGWVWREDSPSVARGGRGRRPIPVAFFRTSGREALIGWIPLGPRDDFSRLASLAAKGALLAEANLENQRMPGTALGLPAGSWPGGVAAKLKRPPRGARLVSAERLVGE